MYADKTRNEITDNKPDKYKLDSNAPGLCFS